MIPPCDPSVLESNPRFKRLYQHLTSAVLNADGTTARADENGPRRHAVAEELKVCQIHHAKRQILKQLTRQVGLDSRNGLPDELRETVTIVALFLDSTSPLDEFEEVGNANHDDNKGTSLLAPDIARFHDGIHNITPHLSGLLASKVDALRAISDIPNNIPASSSNTSGIPVANQSRSRARTRPSVARPNQPRLSEQLAERIRRLRALQISELPASRRQMAETAAAILVARAELMERVVVLLERTKHGVLSRATKAHAEHLATVAEGMDGKVQVMKLEALTTIYTPETVAALENYREHLRETRMRLEEMENLDLQTLEEYESVGSSQTGPDGANRPSRTDRNTSGPMANIARRYGALAKEVEAIRMEIKRLEV